MTTLMQASRQWASRPSDERFLSLHELRDHVQAQRDNSRAQVVSVRDLEAAPDPVNPRNGLVLQHEGRGAMRASNWAFGQLAQLAKAPAGYLRTLPAPMAADCINYGLKFAREAEDVGLLATRQTYDAGGDGLPASGVSLRAATGPAYGRVWNSDIADTLVDRFGDGLTGDFRVPGEFGREVVVDKQNTTLYAGERDMFVFLADERNRVEMTDRRDGKGGSLARGFFIWNSEVGSSTFGVGFFLFDFVCQNRIVWGAQGYKEMRLRHTKSAPDRWLEEVEPVLLDYAHASAAPIEERIKEAQRKRIDTDVDAFLARRFTKSQVTGIMEAHEREEGRPIETLWDATTGVTAYAKTIQYQDDRVAVERKGGALLDLAA